MELHLSMGLSNIQVDFYCVMKTSRVSEVLTNLACSVNAIQVHSHHTCRAAKMTT